MRDRDFRDDLYDRWALGWEKERSVMPESEEPHLLMFEGHHTHCSVCHRAITRTDLCRDCWQRLKDSGALEH